MRKLKSFRPGQERYKYKGRTFSIVDLCVWPEYVPQPPEIDWEKLMAFYRPYNVELAECPEGKPVEIIGRFTSFEEAREAIHYFVGTST